MLLPLVLRTLPSVDGLNERLQTSDSDLNVMSERHQPLTKQQRQLREQTAPHTSMFVRPRTDRK